MQVKADLSEHVALNGFPHYCRKTRLCVFCDAGADNAYRPEMDWRTTTDAQYKAEVGRLTVKLVVDTPSLLEQVKSSVFFCASLKDFVTTKNMAPNLERAGLKAGMRMLPCMPPTRDTLPQNADLPLELVFFEHQNNSTSHPFSRPSPFLKYPLFSLRLFLVDFMHSMCLGVTAFFVSFNIWAILEEGYSEVRGSSIGETRALRLGRLNDELQAYYRSLRRAVTKVSNISLKTIGSSPYSQKLNLKAAETRHLLPFCVETSIAHGGVNRNVVEAGLRLLRIYELFARADHLVTNRQQEEACGLFAEHLLYFNFAGGTLKPKHHMMIHCLSSVVRDGNPMENWLYADESFNGRAKKSLRT